MLNDNQKNIIKEFLSSDKGSSIIKPLLTKSQITKQREYVNNMMKNKKGFVKRYGKDAEKYMYGAATNKAKKSIDNMNNQKIKEIVRKSLTINEEEPKGQGTYGPGELKLSIGNDPIARKLATYYFGNIDDIESKIKYPSDKKYSYELIGEPKGVKYIKKYIDSLHSFDSEGNELDVINPDMGKDKVINSKKYIEDLDETKSKSVKGTDIGKKIANSIFKKISNK